MPPKPRRRHKFWKLASYSRSFPVKSDFVANSGPINALHAQLQIEGQLHFASDQHGRITVPDAYQITAIDLTFDGTTSAFHQGLYGKIEIGLPLNLAMRASDLGRSMLIRGV